MPSLPRCYHIQTYGCQMNENDSELIAGLLEARGLRPAPSREEADLVAVNTCIVRGTAEDRALGLLASLKALKRERPERLLMVAGCLAQRDGERLLQRLPHLDLAIGTRALPRLGALLDRVIAGEGPIACIDKSEDPYELEATPLRRSALKALVTIMYGCNKYCTYCIVPYTRGVEESRPVRAIVREIEDCVAKGAREVTLVGQNVNSYRSPEARFPELLHRVNDIPGLQRIRYTTPHPQDADEAHFRAVAECDKVCEHLHLPLQSGSNPVLERMRRRHTREEYLDKIARFRELNPGATLTTDLIVGFPGETEAHFEETLDLVRQVRFDAAFTFYYNERSGTKAADWPDDVPLEVKKRRLGELIAVQEEITRERNRALVGRNLEILVEGPARRADAPDARGNLMGRSRGDKCVVFQGDPVGDLGQLRRVQVQSTQAHTLFGRLVAERAPA